MSRRNVLLAACLAASTACDPGVHLGWQEENDGSVDATCIESVLKTVASDVRRATYISEGRRGFPRGTEVTQFNYRGLDASGGYTLDIARLPDGRTHVYHGWGAIGTHLTDEERAAALPLLGRVNEALGRRCGLRFNAPDPEERAE